MIGKGSIERICRSAGMLPAKRDKIDGVEVFIADGFAANPSVTFKTFGVESKDFPFGCFATLWWVSRGDEKLDTGQPLFFDAFHDSQYSPASKKLARINTALQEAAAFLKRRKKARLN